LCKRKDFRPSGLQAPFAKFLFFQKTEQGNFLKFQKAFFDKVVSIVLLKALFLNNDIALGTFDGGDTIGQSNALYFFVKIE
jgi:hypothetical protein